MIPRFLDQFDFHQVIAETPGTSLVCFTTHGCGACKAMRRALSDLNRRRPELNIFEVDSARDLALVREFEVFHLPSLFLYHAGRFHAALHCEPLADRLIETIHTHLAAPAEDPP